MSKTNNKILYTTRGRTIEQNNNGNKLPPSKSKNFVNLQQKSTKNNYSLKKSVTITALLLLTKKRPRMRSFFIQKQSRLKPYLPFQVVFQEALRTSFPFSYYQGHKRASV